MKETYTTNTNEISQEPIVFDMSGKTVEKPAEAVKEAPVVVAPESQESAPNTAKGHERSFSFAGAMKKFGGALLERTKSVGGKVAKVFKAVSKFAGDGIGSIDDAITRGIKKGGRGVKEAYTSVKDAITSKTKESVMYARDSVGEAYDNLKEKGAGLVEGARSKVRGLRDGALAIKTQIALSSLERRYMSAAAQEEAARTEKERIGKILQEKYDLLTKLHAARAPKAPVDTISEALPA